MFNGARHLRFFQWNRRANSLRFKRAWRSCSMRDCESHLHVRCRICEMPSRICCSVIAGVHFFSPQRFADKEPSGDQRERLMMLPAHRATPPMRFMRCSEKRRHVGIWKTINAILNKRTLPSKPFSVHNHIPPHVCSVPLGTANGIPSRQRSTDRYVPLQEEAYHADHFRLWGPTNVASACTTTRSYSLQIQKSPLSQNERIETTSKILLKANPCGALLHDETRLPAHCSGHSLQLLLYQKRKALRRQWRTATTSQ